MHDALVLVFTYDTHEHMTALSVMLRIVYQGTFVTGPYQDGHSSERVVEKGFQHTWNLSMGVWMILMNLLAFFSCTPHWASVVPHG